MNTNLGLKLFDTDGITDFIGVFIINFENNQQTTKSMDIISPECKELIISIY